MVPTLKRSVFAAFGLLRGKQVAVWFFSHTCDKGCISCAQNAAGLVKQATTGSLVYLIRRWWYKTTHAL